MGERALTTAGLVVIQGWLSGCESWFKDEDIIILGVRVMIKLLMNIKTCESLSINKNWYDMPGHFNINDSCINQDQRYILSPTSWCIGNWGARFHGNQPVTHITYLAPSMSFLANPIPAITFTFRILVHSWNIKKKMQEARSDTCQHHRNTTYTALVPAGKLQSQSTTGLRAVSEHDSDQ